MGCASSALLHQDPDFPGMSSTTAAAFTHHIVSLTSSTYGLLSLDPLQIHADQQHKQSSTTPRHRITLESLLPFHNSDDSSSINQSIINSWDLMSDRIPSFRFFPKSQTLENSPVPEFEFQKSFPPKGENKVVVYITSLRGIRKTFEECNSVRAAITSLGFMICERDISMDRGYRDELETLMEGKPRNELIPPRVFVNGKYIGGAEEVMALYENGMFAELLQGLPKMKSGYVCEGCGGARFLPCSTCNGSCKIRVVLVKKKGSGVVVKCGDCNENGLVRCPICS